MSKIIVVGQCVITKRALYVSNVKPSLLKRGDRGDWGYSHNAEKAVSLTVNQADSAIRDMSFCGYKPKIVVA